MIRCCNWYMHILVSAGTCVCMHALRIVPVVKILHYINNNNILFGMYHHTPILYLEVFIIYWLGVRNFEDSKNNWYKQSFQF